MSGLLFITASTADHKAINKILLRLRDWEYESGDCFKLLTSKNLHALRSLATATSPPVPENVENAWKGASLEEIEEYLFELDKGSERTDANTHLYIVVDEEGLENETCVLAERVIEWEDDPITYPRIFNRSRVPWDEAYISWCNLDISNIGWDELMEEEEEGKKGGWWTYNSPTGGTPDISKKKLKEMDAEIEKLRKEGKI